MTGGRLVWLASALLLVSAAAASGQSKPVKELWVGDRCNSSFHDAVAGKVYFCAGGVVSEVRSVTSIDSTLEWLFRPCAFGDAVDFSGKPIGNRVWRLAAGCLYGRWVALSLYSGDLGSDSIRITSTEARRIYVTSDVEINCKPVHNIPCPPTNENLMALLLEVLKATREARAK